MLTTIGSGGQPAVRSCTAARIAASASSRLSSPSAKRRVMSVASGDGSMPAMRWPTVAPARAWSVVGRMRVDRMSSLRRRLFDSTC